MQTIKDLEEYILKREGVYGLLRLHRAMDEIPGLVEMFGLQGLKEVFSGDNAKAAMTMNPADFENYASPLDVIHSRGPIATELARQGDLGKHTLTTEDHVKHLQGVGPFESVPYLDIDKEEAGLPMLPTIAGHEGRHRSRALSKAGKDASLVLLSPRSELREPLPRRSRDEYIGALKDELRMTNNMVIPQKYGVSDENSLSPITVRRPAIKLPEIYAEGGSAKSKALQSMAKSRIGLESDIRMFEQYKKEAAMRPQGEPFYTFPEWKELRQQMPHLPKLAKGGNDFGMDSMAPKARSRTSFDDQPKGNQIIKDVGGNWLTGRLEEDLKPLKSRNRATGQNNDPKESMAEMQEVYTPEAIARLSPESQAHVRNSMQDLQHKIALNDWVDRNLKTYVKNQMATKSDPIRLYIGKRQLEIQSQYLKDKDRAKRMEERAAQDPDPNHRANLLRNAERMHAEAELAKEDAMGHIVPNQKNLPQNNYSDVDIKKERQEAGFPAEGIGESALEKQWERASDEAVASHRIGDIQAAPAQMELRNQAAERLKAAQDALTNKAVNQFVERGLSPDQAIRIVESTSRMELARMVGDTEYPKAHVENYALNKPMLEVYNKLHANNPWVDKADPNARVYSPYTGDLGFDHIMDILRQDLREGRIKPEQLNKVSIEHAVRRTAERDLEQTKKMRETQIKQTEGMPLVKQYDTGHKWIELAKPEALPEGWKPSAIVGSYYDAENNFQKHPGEKILEDALKYEGDTMGHCVGGYTPDVLEGRSRIFSLRDAKGEPHVTVEVKPLRGSELGRYAADLPDGEDVAAMKNPPQRIAQIKGKGNGKPAAKYLPMVQDFVKSSNWHDVDDLQNTGLMKVGNQFLTKEEHESNFKPRIKNALTFLKSLPPQTRLYPQSQHRIPETIDQIANAKSYAVDDQDRFNSLHRLLTGVEMGMAHHGYEPPKATGGTIRMAKGGSTGDIDEMRLALMNKPLPKQKRDANLAKFLEPSAAKKRLYHGTGKDIKEFDKSKIKRPMFGEGFHLAESPALASFYAEQFKDGQNVMPVHAQIKNPFVLKSMTDWYDVPGNTDAERTAWVKSKGFDGIKYPHGASYNAQHESGTGWVAFEPTQIKSATGNRGTYDTSKADINMNDGGEVKDEDEPVRMKLKGDSGANKRMIEDVYSKYPVHPFNSQQRAMVEGEGENQTLGTFELKPSMSARNAVELSWLSAYPHKQGVGSRTLKKLQEHATEHNVGMTLFPWKHGGVSEAKLMKFYRKHGFVPTVKGSKSMIWKPEEKAKGGTIKDHITITERPL
jgi:hypothetical protein